jgi:hypothetical protein
MSPRRIADLALLIVAAIGVLVTLVGGAFILDAWGLGDEWSTLWMVAVLLFLGVGVTGVRIVRERRRALHRRWPLVGAFGSLLVAHIAALSFITETYKPHWHMSEWLVVGMLEWIVFGIVLEAAYRSCVRVRH